MLPLARRLMLCACCLPAATALAGSYIESRDADDVRQRLYIDGNQVRVESDDADEYIIIDMQQRRYYSINDAEQQIVDMSSLLRKGPTTPPKIALEFSKQGPGPKVGGYATERYRIKFKNTHCFDELLSTDALKVADLKHYYTAAQQLDFHEGPAEASAAESDADAVCAEAAMLLNTSRYADIGIPMATLDTQGDLEHEVVQIVTDIAFPPETFGLPQAYARTSIVDLMRESARELLHDKALAEP